MGDLDWRAAVVAQGVGKTYRAWGWLRQLESGRDDELHPLDRHQDEASRLGGSGPGRFVLRQVRLPRVPLRRLAHVPVATVVPDARSGLQDPLVPRATGELRTASRLLGERWRRCSTRASDLPIPASVSALASCSRLPGLAIGSFLNVVAARVPLRRSIVHPPSACTGCGHEIAAASTTSRSSRGCSCEVAAGTVARASRSAIPRSSSSRLLLVVACFAGLRGRRAYAVLASVFCVVLVVLAAIDLELQDRPEPDRPAGGGGLSSSRTR